jgi:hypothetical protein
MRAMLIEHIGKLEAHHQRELGRTRGKIVLEVAA